MRFQFSIFNFQKRKSAGFTLFEIIVAIGLFTVLVVAVITLMTKITDAQKKVTGVQAVQDNVRFSLELMTKEMRTGRSFAAYSSCGQGISFITAQGQRRVYYLDSVAQQLLRMAGPQSMDITACASAVPFTASEVTIDRVGFLLRGTAAGASDGQPTITVSLSVRSKNTKLQLESLMNLQTTVVSRLRDF